MNILENLNADANHLNEIRNQLFDVVVLPNYPPSLDAIQQQYGNVPNDVKFVRPQSFTTYRNTGGQPLGIKIGKDFVPTQPNMLFDSFTNCLIEVGYDLSKLQYTELKDGSKVRFSIDLEGISFKNRKAKVDDIHTSLILETGYDGLTKTTYSLQTERLVCTNGMTVTDSKTAVSFKNTKGNFGKIGLACEDISKMALKVGDYKKQILAYDSKEVNTKDVNAFLKKIAGYDQTERTELGKVKNARLDAFMESIELEFGRTGATAWGLLNGATYFTNHVANTDNREDYLYAGGGRLINANAEKFVNALIS